MKDKFVRTKKFVQNHKVSISTVTGIAIGTVAAVSIVKANQPHVLTKLHMTTENLQYLIDNTEAVISYNVSPRDKIWIINAASKEEL